MNDDRNSKPPIAPLKREAQWTRFASAMSSAAIMKVALVTGGWWVGSQLDRWLGTKPWLMLLCFIVGAGLGFWYLVYVLEKHRPR